MSQPRSLGLLFAMLAVMIWSGNFIIASGIVDAMPPITLAALRWGLATVVFLPFAIKHIRRDWEALRAYRWPLLLASITGVSFFNTLVYISARTTDTVNMALFASTTPVFVVILSRIFLNERISKLRALGLVVAIGGMVTIAAHGNLSVLLNMEFRIGDVWMFIAGLLWAIYSILVKKKPLTIHPFSFLGATFLLGSLPLIPAAIIEQQFVPPWSVTPAIFGAVVYIGLGASLAAFFLWNSAVMLVGPGTASLFQYFLPVFSGIGAFFLLAQPITMSHGLGFVLICTGVFMATRPR